MAEIDKKMIGYLTQLSRIHCSDKEQEALEEDLKKILTYIDQLNEINTDNTPPCNQVLEGMMNVMREDEPGETMPREVALSLAPSQVSGLYRVPEVIKQKKFKQVRFHAQTIGN